MTSPSHLQHSGSPRLALAAALFALLAAAAAYVLPAWDAALPGGAIVWQLAALAAAAGAALWAWRRRPPGALFSRAGLVRLIVAAALLVALGWLIGVGILWLVWPR